MSEEANFSVTVKTPRGNLVTVRGDTAAEWKANLEAAGTSGALAMITQVEASLAAAAANPTTQGASGGHQASQAQPSATTATAAGQPSQELPPGFANPSCGVCGGVTRFDKAGTSQQSGRPYKRFLCTTDPSHKATFTD